MLIPNVAQVERSLGEFADIMEANEVLLFEKSTCTYLPENTLI